MSQIIQIQVGQCGNKFGEKFWHTICQEHNLNFDGLKNKQNINENNGNLGTFFSENFKQKYYARSIMVDLEPGALDQVMGGKCGMLFREENFIAGRETASNIFARGYFSKGQQIIQYFMDAVRRESENCDYLQGFQICNSVCGGTGSGFGSLLIQKLVDAYPIKNISSFSIFPSQKVSNSITQAYNSVLALRTLIPYSNASFMFSNQKIFKKIKSDKSEKIDKDKDKAFQLVNEELARTMAGITCSYRFPGQLNGTLKKIQTNLTPYHKLHFFLTTTSPSILQPQSTNINATHLTHSLFSAQQISYNITPQHSRYLTGCYILRGRISTSEIQEQLGKIRNKFSSYFVQWIPNCLQVVVCRVASKQHKLSSTFIGNSCAITEPFKNLLQCYSTMVRRKCFMHWYINEGMDQLQFSKAEDDLFNLIQDYKLYDYNSAPQEYDEL